MKYLIINRFIIILVLVQSIFAQIEIPSSVSNNQIIKHSYYSLSYNEYHEQADWVAYKLTKTMIDSGFVKRKDSFRIDPSVSTNSAELSDYKGSGYDRGHLCPAADMKISKTAMSETFYMSNMSPQHPSFNRGIWKKLESKIREWAVENDEIYVVTAGVLNNKISKSIGLNSVSVPEYYYKVVLCYSESNIKGIGFLLENKRGSGSLEEYAVSIDMIESTTGINFFPSLPDEVENKIEKTFYLEAWGLEK